MPNGTHPHGKLKQDMATHIASLRRYAIALTRNTDEAEDLVQECLSRAIAGADTFRPDSDLRVWLSDQPVKPGTAGWKVFDDGRWVELGRLKGNKGNQVYDVPRDADLKALRSVTIWCKRFAVSFGAAALT